MAVYFVQAVDGGPIKIGTCRDNRIYQDRLGALQVGNPSKLTVRRVIPGGHREETELHRRFADARVRGTEWFRPTPDLVAFAYALPDELPHHQRPEAYEQGVAAGRKLEQERWINILAELGWDMRDWERVL